jgi:hypothetical protein
VVAAWRAGASSRGHGTHAQLLSGRSGIHSGDRSLGSGRAEPGWERPARRLRLDVACALLPAARAARAQRGDDEEPEAPEAERTQRDVEGDRRERVEALRSTCHSHGRGCRRLCWAKGGWARRTMYPLRTSEITDWLMKRPLSQPWKTVRFSRKRSVSIFCSRV